MNATEYVAKLTKPMEELYGQTIIQWYGHRIRDLRWDELDAIDEGYIEGMNKFQYESYNPKTYSYKVRFDEAYVLVKLVDDHIKVEVHELEPWVAPKPRKATPYERTRAMVYATGNRWAIENFNATH